MCRGFENGSAEQDRITAALYVTTYDRENDLIVTTLDPFALMRTRNHLDAGQVIRTQGAASIGAERLEDAGYESRLLRTWQAEDGNWRITYEGDPRQTWATMPGPAAAAP